ncbi:aromatic compound dioxygenase [Macrolepiota fuliginosa MF-IS2]|uniref:Aromatic compound dioxygenase n=1 Tax=Macrolepiota fuliginosa MF-IS2 TaxID=1400762 RepID=A0A9P6C7L8_9AGAR|nr:aromatic compound dioxygenase [Macrolepiota fuliginosa MF-IS2]
MHFLALVSFAVFCGAAAALPTESSNTLVPRDCSSQVASFNLARRERRGHSKRTPSTDIQALSCVAAPESPLTYLQDISADYVRPPLRQDVTEGQTGLSLTLDVGVMDVTTCQSMEEVMVEVWSPNALGSYGNSFLRGAFTSATNGVAEFQTIFPGFASDSANHINLMIHTNSSMSGTVSHVGQVFFTDRWTDVVGMTAPYNGNTNTRVLNAQDSNYALANSAGYNAVVDIESIHDDWPEGVIGYITVGVNPQRKSAVTVKNNRITFTTIRLEPQEQVHRGKNNEVLGKGSGNQIRIPA